MPVADLSAYKPVPATLGDANQIASGFQAIQTILNGIDNLNFAAGKIFDPTKLMQNGAVQGQALLWDAASSTWKPGSASGGLYRKTTAKTVNTTVAATDLLNGEITIAAGVLGTTGALRMHVWGDFLNNTGAGIAAPRLQVVVGGTTVLDTGAGGSWGASASRAGWYVELKCLQLGAANSQVWDIVHELAGGGVAGANANSVFTVGNGYLHTASNSGGGGINRAVGENQSAVDMSIARTLVLNVINGTSNALYETRLLGALVEIT